MCLLVSVSVSKCQYVSVGVSMCQYVSVRVSMCQYTVCFSSIDGFVFLAYLASIHEIY